MSFILRIQRGGWAWGRGVDPLHGRVDWNRRRRAAALGNVRSAYCLYITGRMTLSRANTSVYFSSCARQHRSNGALARVIGGGARAGMFGKAVVVCCSQNSLLLCDSIRVIVFWGSCSGGVVSPLGRGRVSCVTLLVLALSCFKPGASRCRSRSRPRRCSRLFLFFDDAFRCCLCVCVRFYIAPAGFLSPSVCVCVSPAVCSRALLSSVSPSSHHHRRGGGHSGRPTMERNERPTIIEDFCCGKLRTFCGGSRVRSGVSRIQ